MKVSFLVLVGALLVYFEPGYACGKLSLRAGNISEQWQRRMDLSTQMLEIVRSDTSKPCSYFVTFTSGQGRSQGNRSLRNNRNELEYQLYQSPYRNEGQVLKSLPGPINPSSVIMGAFGSGRSENERKQYYFGTKDIPNPTEFPVSGMYNDSFTVSVYQGAIGGANNPDDSVQVSVRVHVPKMIALSLVPTGSEFRYGDTSETLDFGILKTGDAKDFDLRVITNAGYAVTFSSKNNGTLNHTMSQIKTVVPYKVTVDSSFKNLEGSRGHPVTVAKGRRQSDTQSVRKNVRVTIGQVADQMAGKYLDVITIVATAVE